ncbi:hypothetical protein E6O75_ATG00162 [Venturia nashicola]|uniref:Uncharacterized protein n=1 Tax=Venturia nashicola TaxID=86259 RepID=A0A4Z1PD22_9PEZI|nr:hypothetical protein E6O75_ATG00162 [Venturia nashicola]
MQQDELAGLFARSLNFSNPTPPPEQQQQQVFQKPSEPVPQIIYASSHYVPNPQPRHNEPSPEPEPAPYQPVVNPLSDSEIRDILNRNGINPDTLFLSQVNLFRNAGDDQRLRLLELWRISPPNVGHYDLAKEQASWIETTLNQEEQMARLRYERMMADRQFGNKVQQRQVEDHSMSLEAAQRIERPASAPESRGRSSHGSTAEPYMASGYELLAEREYERSSADVASNASIRYNQASDPVYRGSEIWDKTVEEMANRYGAYEQSCIGVPSMLNGLDEDMEM